MQICLAGSTGFIGKVIVQTAWESGEHVVTPVRALRIAAPSGSDPVRAARSWIAGHPADFRELVSSLRGDVAVNAAGLGTPAARDVAGLRGANAVWPVVLSLACAEAQVPRLVHVSTAAVQGRRDPLDESMTHVPFSPYSRSKAEGEGGLMMLRNSGAGAYQLVLYRPTSVQGAGRRTTAALVRLSRLRHLPVTDGGRQHLPLVLVGDVARACLLLAGTTDPPRVALHPWEGLTTARLLDLLSPGTPRLELPGPVVRVALRGVRAGGRASSRVSALSRQLELLYRGQRIEAHALRHRGYASATGEADWRRLAGMVRGRRV